MQHLFMMHMSYLLFLLILMYINQLLIFNKHKLHDFLQIFYVFCLLIVIKVLIFA